MDIGSIAQLSTTMAETGIRQEVGMTVLKKAQDIQSSTATALIEALPPMPAAPSLPSHLGNRINTTA
ncbi:YjfB family protein [Janthinobacterium psychrotolerans]|uniref:Putative motility protein n=1 Tax=Janthinobacterium psychrotolerans TaxID=1747903 RepID=A0A1A7C043_9BURK|nr:YjfB family protein [Janthinobacterium psychrotolerans]OBV39301.1 putative motility protein [Janthinobacterium psychrotolerans]